MEWSISNIVIIIFCGRIVFFHVVTGQLMLSVYHESHIVLFQTFQMSCKEKHKLLFSSHITVAPHDISTN